VEAFARALMSAHIAQLSAPAVPVCLVTEMQDWRYSRRGKVLDHTDYTPLLLPELEARGAIQAAQWNWRAHPQGELPDGEWESRRVCAWRW
jgi:hypothetical protein